MTTNETEEEDTELSPEEQQEADQERHDNWRAARRANLRWGNDE